MTRQTSVPAASPNAGLGALNLAVAAGLGASPQAPVTAVFPFGVPTRAAVTGP